MRRWPVHRTRIFEDIQPKAVLMNRHCDLVLGLSEQQKLPDNLVEQLAHLDLESLLKLTRVSHSEVDWGSLAEKARPPAAFRVNRNNRFAPREAIERGSQLLHQGKIAMILVAGGQGTRLGFDQPKGMFPIGPLSHRTLFEIFVDRVKALSSHYGSVIPLYVMTSPATHEPTVEYFEQQGRFGLAPDELTIFCQGTMPAVDIETGKLLRASETELALSPNGHGGMLDALVDSGCFEAASRRGIEHFFYGQIDNPLVQVCDEELVGYHALAESDMTTQVVRKSHPLEKVGNVVDIDGKVQIIEYSDLPEEYALRTDESGEMLLWAGNIAVHLFSTAFLKRASESTASLPFHLARKKVPFLDEQGVLQQPAEPNAFKFEKFIFDLLPFARNAIAVEVEKAQGFAPVKNADGAASDTPALASQAISDLHKSWLVQLGVKIG